VLKSNITKLNSTSRSAISTALILIAAAAMYNWMVAPHVNYLSAVQQYKPVIGDIAREKEIITKALEEKKTEMQELSEQCTSARNSLFTHAEAKALLGNLETIAKDTGCILQSLSFATRDRGFAFNQSQDTLHIAANSATLSFTGSYDNIVALLSKLQSRPQKVWIDSIRLQVFDIQSAKLKCDTTITIYVVQDKEETLDG
jgi:Tfp pilus assembly protein PilO